MATTSRRSNLPKDEAQKNYVELAELIVVEQTRIDALALDRDYTAVGPFARLDADVVAARNGKTRGAISNLFGSQLAFQAKVLLDTLNATEKAAEISYPDPREYELVEQWLEAFFGSQAAIGPTHLGEPDASYASLWTIWLGMAPYGRWSKTVATPSLNEYVLRAKAVEQVILSAVDHFPVRLRPGVSAADLACAITSMVEGAWLNQCLTTSHPLDQTRPIGSLLLDAGEMLWRGATEPTS